MGRGTATARPPEGSARPAIKLVPSDELRTEEEAALRELFDEAWSDAAEGGFTEQDWGHAVGGVHVIAEADGHIVAHVSVVERELHTAGHRRWWLGRVATASTYPVGRRWPPVRSSRSTTEACATMRPSPAAITWTPPTAWPQS